MKKLLFLSLVSILFLSCNRVYFSVSENEDKFIVRRLYAEYKSFPNEELERPYKQRFTEKDYVWIQTRFDTYVIIKKDDLREWLNEN